MGPPAASYVPTVRSPIGEHSNVFDDLLARFSRKDGISSLWGKDRHLVEKYFPFRRDGGFYNDDRIAWLKELAEQAKTSSLVQENFYQYLRILAYGLNGNSEILTREELAPLARDADIVLSAWRAATATSATARCWRSSRFKGGTWKSTSRRTNPDVATLVATRTSGSRNRGGTCGRSQSWVAGIDVGRRLP